MRMTPPHHRAPTAVALITITVLIGISRIYLGVHYTSDVITGFCIGLLALGLGIQTLQAVGKYARERLVFGRK